MTKNH